MILRDLPQGLSVCETVACCLKSDLQAEGEFGEEYLVIGDENLHIFTADNGQYTVRLSAPLTDIESATTHSYHGCAVLEAVVQGQRLPLVRGTAALAADFTAMAGVLNHIANEEPYTLPEEKPTTCLKCGLPFEEDTVVCKQCLPKARIFLRLVSYLRPVAGLAIVLALLALLNAGLGLIPAYLNRPLIDGVLLPAEAEAPLAGRMRLLGLLVGALFAAHLLRTVVGIAQGWVSGWLGNVVMRAIRIQLYEHLQFLPMRFYDKRSSGDVFSRINQDSANLHYILVLIAQEPLVNLLLVIGIAFMLFLLNWQLAIIVLLPMPLVLWLSRLITSKAFLNRRDYFASWGRLNAHMAETLRALRVVKAFAQERREIGQFTKNIDHMFDVGIYLDRIVSASVPIFSLIFTLGTLLAWYFGGKTVLLGTMSLGTLITFLSYAALIYQPIQALSSIINFLPTSLAASERIFEILDSDREQHAEDADALPAIAGRVTYQGVNFGYEEHRPVIKNLSFDIAPGEFVGLVGHSGAGKSTTMNLLCRFYRVNGGGSICIDGVHIEKIPLHDLRRQIGFVPQDPVLLSGTIAENIAYARPNASRREIIRAAINANAHDFISHLPDGYESRVGEGGVGLSGGEKQRIAIARALLHDPRILILDEATSHVDVETERQIQEAIDRLTAGRTTFAIAHRLSTLKHAHRLLVLRQGELVEIGTHDELLAREDGEFRRLVDTYREVSRVREIER